MANVQVIVEAKGRDRGARKQLRDLTKLADQLTESLGRAGAASKGLGSVGPIATPGGPRRRSGSGRSSGGKSQSEREYDKTVITQIKNERAQAKAEEKAARARQRSEERAAAAQERAARREVKERERSAKAAAKNAKRLENLSDAQLVELETQKEINARRRRAARASAQNKLGKDPTRKGKGNRLELAENLSTVSGEFERVGDRAESGIRGSFDAFKDYEKGVLEVSTLTDKIPIAKIQEITKSAAEEFGGLPTDQVTAFYAIVSAGATDAAEAQEQLTYANKLAIGGVASQEDAVLAISKSVANFKSQGVDAQQAADSLFTAVKRGQTTVEEMARALPNVAAAAAGAGLSLDETNTALAVLSTRLPNAKEGATSLKAALSNLQKPTKTAREEAKRLGLDFSVAGVKAAGGLEGFLLKLRAAEKFDENTLAKLFDSSEARAAIQNLTDGMEDYRSVMADMEKKEGESGKAYGKIADSSAQKAKKLEAQMELLKIQAGEALVPALTALNEHLGPFIKGMAEFVGNNPRTVAQLAKLAIGVVAFAKGMSLVTSAMSMWNALSGVSMMKADGLSRSINKVGASSSKTGKLASGMRKGIAALPAAFIAAEVAIAAFNVVLDHAQKPLEQYEKHLDSIVEQQQNISFKNEKGEEKSEEELLLERRNRLIDDVNATRTLVHESGGGAAADKLMSGDVGAAFGQAYGALLNRGTGVQDDYKVLQRQAELDLAKFDAEYGGQLGLREDQKFVADDGASLKELVELARKQYEATEKVASNTAGSNFLGSTIEAGI